MRQQWNIRENKFGCLGFEKAAFKILKYGEKKPFLCS